jgi:hypothetical protein
VSLVRVGGVQPNAQEPRTPRVVDHELGVMRRKGLIRFGVQYAVVVLFVHESSVYSRESVVALLSLYDTPRW